MHKGTVKFYNETKGFGFIIEDGNDVDIFVHLSGLRDKIRNGDVVEFEIKETKKGLSAVNVRLVQEN